MKSEAQHLIDFVRSSIYHVVIVSRDKGLTSRQYTDIVRELEAAASCLRAHHKTKYGVMPKKP